LSLQDVTTTNNNNFESIRIGLASPEKIRAWSSGEVKKPETINYRTLKPERDGLFCERIFGPTKDWECHCGKYKRVRYKGVICDRCGVEVTRSKVRRERLGHIELAAPVSHIWYFKGIPSRMGLILDMSPRTLEKVLYFVSYIVLDPGDVPDLDQKQLLNEAEYRELKEQYGSCFRAGMGAEAIKELLGQIDMAKLSEELRIELRESTGQRRVRAIRRLEVVEAFRKSGDKADWMIFFQRPTTNHYSTTSIPILRAVPSTIRMAPSTSIALRSFIFSSAISRTFARETLPTFSRLGSPDAVSIPKAFFNKIDAGGVFVMKLKVLS
jgi:DNA-directed RNA polymerase beta' subunit